MSNFGGQEQLLQRLPALSELTLPPGVSRAIALVDEPGHTDSAELAAAIEETPELARVVLTYMNSPLYAPQNPVTCVESAVTGLGYEVIRNFIAVYMTGFLLKGGGHQRPAFDEKEYWRHVLSTCIAADMLGRRVGFEDTFRLFTYGLIHDIGFVALEARYPEQLDKVYRKVRAGVPLIVAEKAVLGGFTHSDVGAYLCALWKLDDEAGRVVRYHHTPLMAPVQSDELLLLYLGNLIGTRVYEQGMKVNLGDNPVDERIMERLGLTGEEMAEVDGAVDGELERFERLHIFPKL